MAAGRQRFSIISDGLPTQLPDIDPDETREWVDSFDSVVRTRGRARARYVMLRLLERARVRTTLSNESTHSRVSSGSMSGNWVGSPSLMIEKR